MTITVDDLSEAEMTFLAIQEEERQHFRVEIEPRTDDKSTVFLDVYDDGTRSCKKHYLVVYVLFLVNLVIGHLFAYTGSGQACYVRPPQSVRSALQSSGSRQIQIRRYRSCDNRFFYIWFRKAGSGRRGDLGL